MKVKRNKQNQPKRTRTNRGMAALPERVDPVVGDAYLDSHGVMWRVAATYDTGTPRVTVSAGDLRRTMTIPRLIEVMERVP